METKEKEVMLEYEYVRLSGATNMLDRATVALIADEHGLDALLPVAMSRAAYAQLLKSYTKPNDAEYNAWKMTRPDLP